MLANDAAVDATALDMIHRYGFREAAIEQAHAYDLEAVMDEERAFWRAGWLNFV